MKILVSILCCFVLSKKRRKEIRNKLVKSKERRKKLLNYGCTIEGEVAITKEQIRFDISDYAKACSHIGEILVEETYNLSCKEDSVVIDIGMNRAIASLFFAAKENVKKVYAYEPFKPTLALAQKNLDLNPELNKKIQTFAYGLGKKDTTLDIPYSINLSDCMSTTHTVSVKHNVRTETVTVKDAAQILAPIFEENKNNRIIVKCDCEGAEFEILERLEEENLVVKIDAILMEYHFKKPDRLVKVLTENSFAVHVIHGSKKEPITGYLYAAKMQKMG
ncbi:MAG: FkbM family methyltransferase [Sedimentisphaerales bacterium]|nr:FkbM family methyltransferase [Sedimentisphaerales bacterium]